MKATLGFAGAAVLLVLAVLAALLAADVRGWRTTLRQDDAITNTATDNRQIEFALKYTF